MPATPLIEKVTLSSRTSSRLSPRALALLDALIGMAIFALIAVVAVIAVGQFRQRAFVTGAISDARSVGLSIESAATQTGAFPTDLQADGTGDRAIVATVASTTVSTAPGTVEKKIGVITPGNRLGGYTYLPATAEDGAGFQVCVEHVENGAVDNESAVADAHAVYDSVAGGVIISGSGDCEAAMDTLPGGTDDEDDETGGPGDGDGDGEEENPAGLPAPLNVSVETVDGRSNATVTWDEVPGAVRYSVYLDGADTPAWTGPELTTDLTGLAGGTHEVVVVARADGAEGAKSEPEPFEIYEDNDYIRWAHPVGDAGAGVPWLTRDYTNINATVETGEPTGTQNAGPAHNGMWWKLKATKDATYTLNVLQAADGSALYSYPQVAVWRGDASSVTALGAPVVASNGSIYSRQIFYATAGETYMIRVSAGSANYDSKYRLSVTRGPENDMLVDAVTVPPIGDATWTSEDTSNVYAGPQTGEDAESDGSMWWKFTANRTTTYKFDVAQASNGATLYTYPQIAVWRSTSTNAADLPLPGALVSNYLSPTVSFPVTAGQTYKIRVSTASSHSASYRTAFRVRVTAGPTNDYIGDATPVSLPGDVNPWTSDDVNNTLAGPEDLEPDGGYGSMWWTFTAPRTTTIRVNVLAPADGTALFTYPKIRVWRTTSTAVTSLGTVYATNAGGGGLSPVTSFPVVAGETFKIRVSTENQGGNYRSKYRVRVSPGPANDSLADATNVPVGSGGQWTSPDVDNTLAGPQANEPDGGYGGMWWTVTPTVNGTLTFEAIQASDGSRLFTYPKIRVFRTAALSVSDLGTEYASNRQWGGLNPISSFGVTAGETYKIRVSSEDTTSADYRSKYRVRVNLAPAGGGEMYTNP